MIVTGAARVAEPVTTSEPPVRLSDSRSVMVPIVCAPLANVTGEFPPRSMTTMSPACGRRSPVQLFASVHWTEWAPPSQQIVPAHWNAENDRPADVAVDTAEKSCGRFSVVKVPLTPPAAVI